MLTLYLKKMLVLFLPICWFNMLYKKNVVIYCCERNPLTRLGIYAKSVLNKLPLGDNMFMNSEVSFIF